MNIPNLPTDSLYKFMALTGLIGYLLLIIGIFYFNYWLNTSTSEIEGQLKIIDIEITQLENLQKEYLTKRDLLFEHFKKVENPNSDLSMYKDSLNLLNYSDSLFQITMFKLKLENKLNTKELTILDEFNEISKQLVENLILVRTKHEQNRLKIEENKFILFIEEYLFQIYYFSVVIFSISLILGFVLWYNKIQRFQDMIIRKQAGYKEPEREPIFKNVKWLSWLVKKKRTEDTTNTNNNTDKDKESK